MNILFNSIVDLKKSQNNRPQQFLKYLSEKNNVTVISINDWWKSEQFDFKSYSSEFDYIFDRVNYNYLTDKKMSPIIQEILCRSKINKIVHDNDFDVQFNYNTLTSGYNVSKNIPTVFDIADDLVAMIKESPQIPCGLKTIGSIMGNMSIHKNIHTSKKITIINESLSKKYEIPDNKKTIITNGVDSDMFKSLPKAKKDLGINEFIIGYVGVLREWVDFEPLFKITNSLPKDIKILIVGKEGFFDKTVNMANNYNIRDRVIFTGNVKYSEVPKYISSMDICLIPFKQGEISGFSCPLKLFEYMSCEKPIVSTEMIDLKKINKDLLFYRNEKELYEQIMILYDDKKRRTQIGKKGRVIVENNYNWKNMAEKLEKTLESIAQ